MNITYALQPLPKSIFLAGPTPRSEDITSWRPIIFIFGGVANAGVEGTSYFKC